MNRIKIDLPETFSFSTTLTVRVSDINYGGHLSNDALLAFLHEARLRFLESYGYSEKDISGCGLIMADSVVEYKSQAFRGDEITIEVSAGSFEMYSFDIFYRCTEICSSSEVARAKTGMAAFDYNENKLAPLPDQFISALTKKH
ncbi:acyl-CoA thioesterase [Planctomycetota bacterium]